MIKTASFLNEHARKKACRAYSVMVKVAGPACNLDCDYCYYLEKSALVPGETRMSRSTLEVLVRDVMRSAAGPVVTFVWHGGEPTLVGLDYFREIVRLQEKYANGKRVENVLQTNGTLVDDRWAEFLARHRFLCGLSVDGPRALHDTHRRYAGGSGSWEKAAACARLFRKHGVEFNTMTAVNATNGRHPVAVYEAMKELGSHYMQFIPIVEHVAEDENEALSLVTPRYPKLSTPLAENISAAAWGNFLCRVFDRWVQSDVGKYYVNYFDNTLAAYIRQCPSLCSMAPCCACSPVVECNGDVYRCDHQVYPEFLMGNIHDRSLGEMVKDDEQIAFELDKQNTLPSPCRACEFLHICGGDCPKNRYDLVAPGENLSSLCEGFRVFFRHTRRYFEEKAKTICDL